MMFPFRRVLARHCMKYAIRRLSSQSPPSFSPGDRFNAQRFLCMANSLKRWAIPLPEWQPKRIDPTVPDASDAVI